MTGDLREGGIGLGNHFMEVTYDKFVFRVESSYFYHPDECWVKKNDGLITVGVTDFFQKTVGDIIFIDLPEIGTKIAQGDEAGTIETIKVNVTLISPVSGTIEEINDGLRDNPQWVNSDPYGAGWLYKIAPNDWEADKKELMDARTCFSRMKEKINKEIEKKQEGLK
jgi:glycine cleavage system H protein